MVPKRVVAVAADVFGCAQRGTAAQQQHACQSLVLIAGAGAVWFGRSLERAGVVYGCQGGLSLFPGFERVVAVAVHGHDVSRVLGLWISGVAAGRAGPFWACGREACCKEVAGLRGHCKAMAWLGWLAWLAGLGWLGLQVASGFLGCRG